MPLSLYDLSVLTYQAILRGLAASIDKAEAYAAAHDYKPGALIEARLFPDMWNFGEQVKAATNHAFRGAARIAGLPIPPIPEAVGTFDEVRVRIAATLDYVASVDRALIDGGVDRPISFVLGNVPTTMTGLQYFQTFNLPNFYFHATTAYDILRHNGVPLEKSDFLGS